MRRRRVLSRRWRGRPRRRRPASWRDSRTRDPARRARRTRGAFPRRRAGRSPRARVPQAPQAPRRRCTGAETEPRIEGSWSLPQVEKVRESERTEPGKRKAERLVVDLLDLARFEPDGDLRVSDALSEELDLATEPLELLGDPRELALD